MAIRNIAMDAYLNAQGASKLNRATGAYSDHQPAKAGETARPGFGTTLKDSLTQVNDLQAQKADMIEEFASGEKQNVHELMISLQKAGVAMRMTSAVRNKVMEAYKQLSKMHF